MHLVRKPVEICNRNGRGDYMNGYEFAAMPYPNQENKLKALISQIKLGNYVQFDPK